MLASQVMELAELLSSARSELSNALQQAHEAVPGAKDSPETLPTPGGAPIPDLTPVTAHLVLKRPLVLSKLGTRLVRRYLRRQLEAELGPAIAELLSRYRRQLREWFRRSVVELRDGFVARAGIYRAQLEVLNAPPATAAARGQVEADLRVLQNWPLGTVLTKEGNGNESNS